MPDDKPADDSPKPPTPPLTGRKAGIILIIIAAAMIPAAWFPSPLKSFLALMSLMIIFMMVLGLRISGRYAGILINDRNLMSLSRFQLIVWTVLILSAFMTAVIERVHYLRGADALAIMLDERLWILLGISTASLVGTPLVQSPKKVKKPSDEAVAKAATELNEDKKEVSENAQGVLYANASIKDASFSDMFQGDEVGNTAYVDVAKVQNFFFTLVAVFIYGASLFSWLYGWDALKNPAAFPPLNDGLIALFGISHAGFLASQSTTQTPSK